VEHVFFIHKSITFGKISINNCCLEHDIEISGVNLEMTTSNIYIFFIEHPQAIFTNFFTVISIFKLFMNPNTKFIIFGDINIHLVDSCRRSQTHHSFPNLFDTVDFPTRIQNTTVSAIIISVLIFLDKETL
jgi:hypothetical protein